MYFNNIVSRRILPRQQLPTHLLVMPRKSNEFVKLKKPWHQSVQFANHAKLDVSNWAQMCRGNEFLEEVWFVPGIAKKGTTYTV